MAWYDSIIDSPINPLYLPMQYMNKKEDEKEQQAQQANASNQIYQDYKNFSPGQLADAKAAGRAKGEGLFGQQSDLTPISQDILKRRQDLSQGLNANEMSAIRAGSRNQINRDTQTQLSQLQGIQGRQGIKGGAAGSQQASVLLSGADQNRQFEQNLVAQNYAARNQGVNNLAGDVNARLYGIQAAETGGTNEELARQSLSQGLAINSLPAPAQPKQGILSGVTGELSVICTELKRQELLDPDTQKADCIYGLLVLSQTPHVYWGYVVWAKYIASLMKKSPGFTKFVSFFAVPWANHMAFTLCYRRQDNLFGRIIHNIGYPLCGILGKLVMKARGVSYGQ